MAQHKWHKEIKAWADGAEIEFKSHAGNCWITMHDCEFDNEYMEFRIKPQPKEPQYLYVFSQTAGHTVRLSISPIPQYKHEVVITKIKLEVE
jgi:hypothetical protein